MREAIKGALLTLGVLAMAILGVAGYFLYLMADFQGYINNPYTH